MQTANLIIVIGDIVLTGIVIALLLRGLSRWLNRVERQELADEADWRGPYTVVRIDG